MRTLAVSLLLAAPVIAAPVPKALKRPPAADGVWECVEFNGYNGKSIATAVGTYWRIDGDKMSTGKKSPDGLAADESRCLRVRDERNPNLQELVVEGKMTYSCVFELDGDTLRWAWATDLTKTITECKPDDGVYYYVFKRVKAEK